jgi:hypothetical protein
MRWREDDGAAWPSGALVVYVITYISDQLYALAYRSSCDKYVETYIFEENICWNI